MAYFHREDQRADEDYQPVFNQQPLDDDTSDYTEDYTEDEWNDTDTLYEDDDFLAEEEWEADSQGKWRVLAGVGDFLSVIAGTVVILLLIALLVSLITWVKSDIQQSFTLWQTKL